MNYDKILSKIKKLLSLSESDNANESELAMSMAVKMMAKYNIDSSEIIIEENRASNVNEETMKGKPIKNWPKWKQTLIISVCDLFECKARFVNSGSGKMSFSIIGFKQDIEMVQWTYSYLEGEVSRACSTAIKNEIFNGQGKEKKFRKSFRSAASSALNSKIKKIIEERNKYYEESNCKGLVISKAKAIEEKYGIIKYGSRKGKSSVDSRAYNQGKLAGEKIEINTPLN